MATFLDDTFTETLDVLLTSHTPETGGTWVEHSSYPDDLFVDASGDHVKGSAGAGIGLCYNTASPATADYYVEGQVVQSAAIATYPVIAGRIDTASDTMYRVLYRQDGPVWRLEKVVSGTVTILGSDYTQTLTNGVTYTAKLELSGSSITLYIDGISRISVTDSSISAAGKAGVGSYANGGQQVSRITAADLGGGGGGSLPFITVMDARRY